MDGAHLSNIHELNAGDIVGGDKNIYLPPPEVVQRLHQLPPPPADFVGRTAQLAELRQHAPRGATISGVHGLGGIGKTALALKFAAGLRDQYPDAQFFLDLRGASDTPVTPADALAHVIRAYHPESKLPDDMAQLRALYLSVLEGQRAVVMFDNARDAAHVAQLIPPPTCYLLLTARQEFVLPGYAYPLHLEQLTEGEARELIRAILTRIPLSDAEADDLARVCGYLPLATRAAASALQESRALTPAKLLERLRDAPRRLQLEGLTAAGVPLTVAGCFALSYDLLPPELQGAWRALSVFTARFDDEAAQVVAALPDAEPLEVLVKWGLVEYVPAENRYTLHDLARLYAASRQTPEERLEVGERHAGYYLELIEACKHLLLKGGDAILNGLTRFDAHRAHIEAGQAWAAAHFEGLSASQMADASTLPTAAGFCNRYARQSDLLSLRFHPRQQIEWVQLGLSAARQLKDRGAEGVHLTHLGNAYANLGEPRRAIEFYEQALVIDRAIGDRRGEGNALSNLGIAYKNLGEPRRAIEFHEQSLVIKRTIGDKQGEGNALIALGLAYADLGELRRAIEFYEQALVIDRAIGDKRGEGNALGNLGIAYADLGEPRRAIEFYEQALVIHRAIGDRRGEGNTLGNLGNTYADLGEPRRAIEFYEQRLVIAHDIGDRRGEGNALWNMSLTLDKLGERQKALACAEAALKIYEAIESPFAGRVREKIAEWQRIL